MPPLNQLTTDRVEDWIESNMGNPETFTHLESDKASSNASSSPARAKSPRHYLTEAPLPALRGSLRPRASHRAGRNGRNRDRDRVRGSTNSAFYDLLPPASRPGSGHQENSQPLERSIIPDRTMAIIQPPPTRPARAEGSPFPYQHNSGQHHRSSMATFRPGRSMHPRNPMELVIRTSKLPKSVDCNTWIFYQLFENYGSISYIRVDFNLRTAVIFFRPAPQDVSWVGQTRSNKFLDSHGNEFQTSLYTSDSSTGLKIYKSPKGDVSYPEQMMLALASIDFGVMKSQNLMLIMNSFGQSTNNYTRLTLDLRKKRMLLNFNINLPHGTQTFMVKLDIAQMHEMLLVHGSDGCVSVIITVDSPPEVYKKASNIKETHEVHNAKEWNEYKAWYRQTDLGMDSASRSGVVQLRKLGVLCDTGRWLTYRLKFDPSASSSREFEGLCQALADHNVLVDSKRNVEYSLGTSNTSWGWLDTLDRPDGLVQASSSLADLFGMAETIHLPFPVQYQLEVCLSLGILHECNIDMEFLKRLAALESRRAVKILEKLAERKERMYDPQQVFDLQNQVSIVEKKRPVYCSRIPAATVTPTTVYFSTPVLETSNRVVRNYHQHEDRFLRVKFLDEKSRGTLHSEDGSVMDEIYSRIERAITEGIIVAGRRYEFLAFGSSQFREHGAYFFASTNTLSAAAIRHWMGDFTDFSNVAKYISRLGLCFTTTRGIPHKVELQSIADVERNGYKFTDGVGKISALLADMIASHYKLDYRPSVFQFRMAGCKGVLAVDPSMRGLTVGIRKSQDKFPAKYYGFEIAKTSKFTSANLNVQLILVLSALGIPDAVFMDKLRTMLADMDTAMTDESMARKLLEKNIDYNQSTILLSQAIGDGFMETQEPFIISWLSLWRSWSLKYLKQKQRIFLEQGAYVFGVTDETGTLRGHFVDGGKAFEDERKAGMAETSAVKAGKPKNTNKLNGASLASKDSDTDSSQDEHNGESRDTNDEDLEHQLLPEIFIQVPNPDAKGGYTVIKGICILTRSPTLHPGDVRVVRAVDVPALHHLKDCVVLPQTGDRDLANMCSGGDLDGDEYVVCWDSALVPDPSEWNQPAMDFTPAKPPDREGPVTISDMAKFFVNHIKNDKLGQIAVAHKIWADREHDGVHNEKCIELAELHSQAVDYPKTGVPAVLPQHLRVQSRPHWSEPRGSSYKSMRVIGQLYDAITLANFKPRWDLPFDVRILSAYVPSQQNLDDAKEVKDLYDEAVRRIMAQYGIENEFEVITTFVLEHHEDLNDYKFSETIGEVVSSLRSQFMELCYEKAGTTATERDWDKMKHFIVAMYTVTAREVEAAVAESKETIERGGRLVPRRVMTFETMPLMSFPWIFIRELGSIATGRDGSRSLNPLVASARPTLPGDKKARADKKITTVEVLAERYGELEPLADAYAPKRPIPALGGVTMPEGRVLHEGDVMDLHDQKKKRPFSAGETAQAITLLTSMGQFESETSVDDEIETEQVEIVFDDVPSNMLDEFL